MATNRQYESFTIFNARIVDMRHLWNPSTEYQGKKQDKASYFTTCIVPKTQPTWFTEPALAGAATACSKFQSVMQAYQTAPNAIEWPVQDGDMPNKQGKMSDFARGHWIFSASTYDNPPTVELVQAGGQLVKLPNKVGVKSGDYVMLGGTAALNANDARKIKFYLNAVVFTAPGEEIVFANSVSGAELMAQAQQQGLQVAGFSATPAMGGFNAQPNFGGNAHPPGSFNPAPGVSQPGFQQAPQSLQQGFGAPPANGLNSALTRASDVTVAVPSGAFAANSGSATTSPFSSNPPASPFGR